MVSLISANKVRIGSVSRGVRQLALEGKWCRERRNGFIQQTLAKAGVFRKEDLEAIASSTLGLNYYGQNRIETVLPISGKKVVGVYSRDQGLNGEYDSISVYVGPRDSDLVYYLSMKAAAPQMQMGLPAAI